MNDNDDGDDADYDVDVDSNSASDDEIGPVNDRDDEVSEVDVINDPTSDDDEVLEVDAVNDPTSDDDEVVLINDNNGEFAMPIAIKNEDVLTGSEKFTANVRKSMYHHHFYGPHLDQYNLTHFFCNS